jgi:D-3-phosphoglycerate dehydrogenase
VTLRIVATDRISDEGLSPLSGDERFTVLQIPDSKDPRFGEELATASGLIVRSATKVDATLLADAPELRVVGRAGVGVDNIDVDAATERGVAVMNAPAGNTIAAAELTLALMLSVARRVAEADRSIREGKWERSRLQGIELRGRTLGVIGAGRIGGAVAERCQAFGMKVVVYDPYLSAEHLAGLDMPVVDLAQLLAVADVVTIHVPLTDETKGLIGPDELTTMRAGSILLNVSRGGIVDETALAAALSDGEIGGAGLDVYEEEPLSADSPLLLAPNLVLTPHLGASTAEAQVQVALEVAAAIRAVLVDGDVSSAINAPALISR